MLRSQATNLGKRGSSQIYTTNGNTWYISLTIQPEHPFDSYDEAVAWVEDKGVKLAALADTLSEEEWRSKKADPGIFYEDDEPIVPLDYGDDDWDE